MNYLEINKASWDKRTKIHDESNFYNVKGFLDGETSLREIELEELKDVEGKSLLHLQCHFGLDTLSWARKGAIVTGVDLSPVAIEKANSLKKQVKLDAEFICSDVYGYAKQANGDFDIVFTSYGAVNWLPCLSKWAATITKSLKSGGMFYMAEFHPICDLILGYSYFKLEQPYVEEAATYTENNNGVMTKTATWSHPMDEVINALIQAGIRIDRLNEFPFSPYNCFDGLEEKETGRFYSTKFKFNAPLIYSIKGTKQ